MSDEMIDRVARALAHRHHGMETAENSWDIAAIFEVGGSQDEFLAQARAAIAAMREPTEEMVLKGLDALYKDVYPGDSVNMAEAYTAMIDAALNSKS